MKEAKYKLLVFCTSNYDRYNKKLFDDTYDDILKSKILMSEKNLDSFILGVIDDVYKITGSARGYGYWIWKPYIILNELKKLNDDEILIYLDSRFSLDHIKDYLDDIYKELIVDDMPLYSAHSCGSNDIEFTTTKLRKQFENHFKYVFTDEELKEMHHEAGILFIRKNEFTLKFFEDWFNFMLSNIEYISDMHNEDDDNPDCFIDNRHDQSVFNLMIKMYKIKKIDIIFYAKFLP